MAVTLLFTGFTRHPKIRRAGEPAAWLFVCGLEYCAEFSTGGFIPKESVDAFGLKGTRARVDRLISVGLWYDRGSDYEVHDYAEWNLSAIEQAERAKAKHDAKVKAGKAGARKRWGSRLPTGTPDSTADSSANRSAIAKDSPGPGPGLSSTSPQPPTPLGEPCAKHRPHHGADCRGCGTNRRAVEKASKRAGEWCGACNQATRMFEDDDGVPRKCSCALPLQAVGS